MSATRSLICVCLAMIATAFSSQAFARTVAVGTCTSNVNFATIQQAVNASASAPGTIIKVCPNTYREQVVINQSVTIQGTSNGTQDAVIIMPPSSGLVQNATDLDTATPIAAQILVQGAGPVNISNLTVDGAGNMVATCGLDLQGILYQNASGMVNRVAVRNQVPSAGFGGCQIGEAIFVQTSSAQTSVVTVANSSIHNYNKNGITGNDAGTTLNAIGNYIQGAGVVASGGAAQNGIQLGFGATGKVASNTVVDNIYGDPTVAASADILLYDTAENSSTTVVSSNTVGNSQLPIVLYTDAPGTSGDGVSVTSNKVFGTSTYDGIDVCTNGNTIKSNVIFNSAESGIHLDASCGSTGINNTLASNNILESACAGILDDSNGEGGNDIGAENYFTVPFTLTASTSRCSLGGAAATARAKSMHKFQPAR